MVSKERGLAANGLFLLFLIFPILFTKVECNDNLRVAYEWKQIDFNYPSEEQRQQAIDSKEFIAANVIPLGLEVYRSRLFVTLPRWKGGVPASLAYLDLNGKYRANVTFLEINLGRRLVLAVGVQCRKGFYCAKRTLFCCLVRKQKSSIPCQPQLEKVADSRSKVNACEKILRHGSNCISCRYFDRMRPAFWIERLSGKNALNKKVRYDQHLYFHHRKLKAYIVCMPCVSSYLTSVHHMVIGIS